MNNKMDLAKEREAIKKWLEAHRDVVVKLQNTKKQLASKRVSYQGLSDSIGVLVKALANLSKLSREKSAATAGKIILGEILETAGAAEKLSDYVKVIKRSSDRSAKGTMPWWPDLYNKVNMDDWTQWCDIGLQLLKVTANKAIRAFNLYDMEGIKMPYPPRKPRRRRRCFTRKNRQKK